MTGLRAALAALLLLLALAGCGGAAPEDAEVGLGGVTPEAVVESFLEDLNAALAAPDLVDPAVRAGWAERLASYFTPSERADQRGAMRELLAGFVAGAAEPVRGTQVELSISYTRTAVLSRSADAALVDVVDGVLSIRWRDDAGDLVLERSGALLGLIGRADSGLPVARVDGRWFLTEG